MDVRRNVVMIALGIAVLALAGGGVYLYADLDRTTTTLRATTATLRTTETYLGATREHLKDRTATLNDTKVALAQTTADFAAERTARNQLQQDKASLFNDKAGLQVSLRTANMKSATLTAENDTLAENLAATAARASQLATVVAAEQDAHTKTKVALSSLEAEHAGLTKTANEFMALYGDVEALKSEIASLHEQRRPLLLKTQRDGLACTGSMEPKLTCLDEVTILRNYASEDITVGTIVVFQGEEECVLRGPAEWLFGNRYQPCLQYLRPWIIHRVEDIGPDGYLTQGDASPESDGWIAMEDVVGYGIQVYRNVNPENARLRNAINAAKAQLDSAEQALAAAEARWEVQVNEYCGANVGCEVYYYDESDEVYVVYQQYERAFEQYKRAFDTYECWYKNAEDAQYPGHIPYSCN